MLFEAMHPLFEELSQGKFSDVLGKTFDLLQKIQDENLDQDLLHSMQDTPDAIRNRIIAELFGFPTASMNDCCSGKKSCSPTKSKSSEKSPSDENDKQETEFLKQQSGSSKETLKDVAARVFRKQEAEDSRKETPVEEAVRRKILKKRIFNEEETVKEKIPQNQVPIEEKREGVVVSQESPVADSVKESVSEGIDAEKKELRPQENEGETEKTEEKKGTPESVQKSTWDSPEVKKEGAAEYEWKFPVESWCRPEDAAVRVVNSIVELRIRRKEIDPETKVSSSKSLDFSVRLPEDAVVDQVVASYIEETSEFVVTVPKRKLREQNTRRSLRINFH